MSALAARDEFVRPILWQIHEPVSTSLSRLTPLNDQLTGVHNRLTVSKPKPSNKYNKSSVAKLPVAPLA